MDIRPWIPRGWSPAPGAIAERTQQLASCVVRRVFVGWEHEAQPAKTRHRARPYGKQRRAPTTTRPPGQWLHSPHHVCSTGRQARAGAPAPFATPRDLKAEHARRSRSLHASQIGSPTEGSRASASGAALCLVSSSRWVRLPGQPHLYPYALDLVERDLIPRPVVELRGPRALVRGDHLRMLERAAVLQVGRDAGGPERVAAR